MSKIGLGQGNRTSYQAHDLLQLLKTTTQFYLYLCNCTLLQCNLTNWKPLFGAMNHVLVAYRPQDILPTSLLFFLKLPQ